MRLCGASLARPSARLQEVLLRPVLGRGNGSPSEGTVIERGRARWRKAAVDVGARLLLASSSVVAVES